VGNLGASFETAAVAASSEFVKEFPRLSPIHLPGEKPGPIDPSHELFIGW
jgi:hypothetical protein